MKIVLAAIIPLAATVAGAAAGYFLQPADGMDPYQEKAQAELDDKAAHEAISPEERERIGESGLEYVRLQHQYIVPVLLEGDVKARVVIGLSVGVSQGRRTEVFEVEPRLRHAFLTELFAHANSGGFSGNFTATQNLFALRTALEESARVASGDLIQGVYISEMGRQDI